MTENKRRPDPAARAAGQAVGVGCMAAVVLAVAVVVAALCRLLAWLVVG